MSPLASETIPNGPPYHFQIHCNVLISSISPPTFLLRTSPLQGYFGKYHSDIFIAIIYSKADVIKRDSWNLTTVTWTLGEGEKREVIKRVKDTVFDVGVLVYWREDGSVWGIPVWAYQYQSSLWGDKHFQRILEHYISEFAWNIPWLCVTPHTLNYTLLAFSPGTNFIWKWTCWAEEVSWGSPRLTYKRMPSLHFLRTTELGIQSPTVPSQL